VKSIPQRLYAGGESGMKYCDCRMPAALRASHPKQQCRIKSPPGASTLRAAKQAPEDRNPAH
jgi:hypothetical protein